MNKEKIQELAQAIASEHKTEEVRNWQNRPLEEFYPILYPDCLVVKVSEDKQVVKKSIYLGRVDT